MEEIIKNWLADLNGKNQNSYKFVLQLALIHFSRKKAVSYSEIAEFFVKRYWDNVVPFKLRETSSVAQLPHFHKAVQETADKFSLDGLFFTQAQRKYEDLCQAVIQNLSKSPKEILQNPISRLQRNSGGKTTGGGSSEGVGWLYHWSSKEEQITFNSEQKSFLYENKSLLEKLTILQYALFIEKYNQAPAIVNKLFNVKSTRKFPKMLRELIYHLDQGKCFYCQQEVVDSYDIDHFIPFAYLFDDPEWDLVLCCIDCNRGKGGKFEKLPKNPYLQKLISRNAQIFQQDPTFFESFKDFEELREHLSKTYEACSNAGFRLWSRTSDDTNELLA